MSAVFLDVSVFSDGRHKGGQYFATENSMVVGDEIVNDNTKERVTVPHLMWENMQKTAKSLLEGGRAGFCCSALKTGCC